MKHRIVHFISTLKDGGAQTQLILLCNNIDLEKFEVHIVCWDNECAIPLRKEINVITLNRGNKFNFLSFFRKVFSITQKVNPNLSHLWLPEMITLPAAIISKYLRIPIINSERRLPSTNISQIVWYRDRIEYLIHLMANIVTTNFPIPIKRKSFFNLLVNKNKGLTVYNGVDFINLANKTIFNTNFNENSQFHIIYCGRFVIQKNVMYLLKAVKELNDLGFNLKLDLFGSGELEKELRLYVDNNHLNQVVVFKGYSKNWKEYSAQANCFVLPTSREGMPNVIFEAMSIGLPVISTNIEEISCHFKNGYDALLLDPKDVLQLRQGIVKLYNDPILASRLKNNALQTIKKYSIKNMVLNYEKLYYQLLKDNLK